MPLSKQPLSPYIKPLTKLSYSASLSSQQQRMIAQEEAALVQVMALLNHLAPKPKPASKQHLRPAPCPKKKKYEQYDLFALTESLAGSSEEDATRIETEINNLQRVSAYREQRQYEDPYDLKTPYFGRLRVKIETHEREVLIGPKGILNSTLTPIIDWRTAPLSPLFYHGTAGEVWDMVLGGKEVEVEIISLHRLSIYNATLQAITCPQGRFYKKKHQWVLEDRALPTLQGGAQTSMQPQTMHAAFLQEKWLQERQQKNSPVHAVDQTTIGRRVPASTLQTQLQAMTGRLDPSQTKAVNDLSPGVLAVRGVAGSGKTTTALYRMAALHQQNPRHFSPKMMAAIVPGRALGHYIAGFLPALGLKNAAVYVFDDWMDQLRTRAMPFFESARKEEIYAKTAQFKRHPAAWKIVQHAIALQQEALATELKSVLGSAEEAEIWLNIWDALTSLPLGVRLQRFIGWGLSKRPLPKGLNKHHPNPPKHWLARKRLFDWAHEEQPHWDTPRQMAVTIWNEAFLNAAHLTQSVQCAAPKVFTPGVLEDVHKSALGVNQALQEQEEWRHLPKEDKQALTPSQLHMKSLSPPQQAPAHGAEEEKNTPWPTEELLEPWRPAAVPMSVEDDVLLLLTCEHVAGPLPAGGGKPLRFRHMLLDEAQDMSHNALGLVKKLCNAPLSITLAGDENQRLLFDGIGEALLAPERPSNVNAPNQQKTIRTTTLEASYRCTAQILHFGQHVLGQQNAAKWRATRQGVDVQGLGFAHLGQAAAFLGTRLRRLLQREPQASIALIARHTQQAARIYQGLLHADIPKLHLVTKQDFLFSPGVEVTDIEQVRGLEFDYVVLLDVDAPTYPDSLDARQALHIAATRAAHQLWITHSNTPSPVLPSELNWHMV